MQVSVDSAAVSIKAEDVMEVSATSAADVIALAKDEPLGPLDAVVETDLEPRTSHSGHTWMLVTPR